MNKRVTKYAEEEPVRLSAQVLVFVNAVLFLLTTFGVELATVQQSAILLVVNTGMALGGAIWLRARVKPWR